jgi:TldD protein
MPSTIVTANVVAREGGEVNGFRTRVGGTEGLEVLDEDPPLPKVSEAAEKAVAILKGRKCPSGRMPVIADGELAGVFVHEALGHACEGDLVMAGESILEGRLGENIGSKLVTVVDDPTIRGAFGSFPYDDEGVRARPKTLVKGGVLTEFINSRSTASKLGLEPNGGCRAQDFSSRPIVRMSNTLLMPGDMRFEELLEGIDMGVYVKGSRGGQVDTAQGSFQFNAQEAYLIEKGRVGPVLKDASLSGSILRTLSDMDGLGNEMGRVGVGFCGKGQWVPVGDGGPHIRICKAVVGGS